MEFERRRLVVAHGVRLRALGLGNDAVGVTDGAVRLHAQVPENDARAVARIGYAPDDGGAFRLDGLARGVPCVERLVRSQLVEHHEVAGLAARVLVVGGGDLVAAVALEPQLLRALAAEYLLDLGRELLVALGLVDRRLPRLLGLRQVLRRAENERHAQHVDEEQGEDHREVGLAVLSSN